MKTTFTLLLVVATVTMAVKALPIFIDDGTDIYMLREVTDDDDDGAFIEKRKVKSWQVMGDSWGRKKRNAEFDTEFSDELDEDKR